MYMIGYFLLNRDFCIDKMRVFPSLMILLMMFGFSKSNPVRGLADITVYEGDDLVIPWNYQYDQTWERQVTYWRYWNSTINRSKKVTLMFKSGDGPAITHPELLKDGQLMEDVNTVAGIIYRGVIRNNSGTYELTMDFLNHPSYVDQVLVTVLEKPPPNFGELDLGFAN